MTGPATRLGSRRPSARRWLARRALRGRVIGGLVTLLALACAAVGVTTYLVLHSILITQLDSQLHASGGSYASCMEANNPGAHTSPGGPAPQGGAQGGTRTCNTLPGLTTGTFGARLKNGVVTDKGIVNGQCNP